MATKRAKQYINEIFSKYTEVNYAENKYFNIIHLYPEKDCYPNGYHDAKWMTVKCYNTETKEMFIIQRKQDALFMRNAKVYNVRIFVDGSTCIALIGLHKVPNIFQASDIECVEEKK